MHRTHGEDQARAPWEEAESENAPDLGVHARHEQEKQEQPRHFEPYTQGKHSWTQEI